MGMAELIDKWEVVSKLITLQNNYNFFKNEWDAERLYREIAKLEIGIGKTPGLQVVRCKDCKHWGYQENCDPAFKFFCNAEALYAWGRPVRSADDFCSHGERKDNDST